MKSIEPIHPGQHAWRKSSTSAGFTPPGPQDRQLDAPDSSVSVPLSAPVASADSFRTTAEASSSKLGGGPRGSFRRSATVATAAAAGTRKCPGTVAS